MMDTLNEAVREYTIQLSVGRIQKAYRGILSFMTDLKAYLGRKYPEYSSGAFYPGYMDMTYFAITPPLIRDMKLKIALVYLHEENRFELWLAANNRHIQAETSEQLSHRDMGKYTLSQLNPGVDAIIATIIAEKPDFADPDVLMEWIDGEVDRFSRDMIALLE